MKAVDKEKALEKLSGLCSRSEQCEFDLNRKMVNWGLSSTDRKEVIEALRDLKFLDNSRYARSYANDKAKFSAWGPMKIRVELIKRKIEGIHIKSALESVEPEVWKEGLLRNANSKSKNLDLTGEDSREDRQKLYRYLIGKGFSSASCSKAVNLMRKRQEEE